MLLPLVICQLSLVAANPFHKYPFVFLLDVGNEELEKTNSEQIRLSVPGGSVALRYPAIGDGNSISHVRVSGIDFGTDLKANIVDGGPGFKYVVLAFIGNPGVAYDAVITVQTINDGSFNGYNRGTVVNEDNDTQQSEEDTNNSAEDFSDVRETENAPSEIIVQNSNGELMQPSSNIYSYADDERINEDNSEIEEEDLTDGIDDDNIESESEIPDNDEDVSDGNAENTEQEEQENDPSYIANNDNADSYRDNIEEEEVRYSPETPVIVDSNLYSKYKAFKDHLNYEGNVYSQEEYQKNARPVYQEDPLDFEESDGNGYDDDDEMNNEVSKYKDFNNNVNNVDVEDSYAVAY